MRGSTAKASRGNGHRNPLDPALGRPRRGRPPNSAKAERGVPPVEAAERNEVREKVITLTKASDTFTLYAVCVWVIQQLHIATPEMILDFMVKNLRAKVSNLRVLKQSLEALRSGQILASVDNYQTDNGLARAYQIRKDSALPGFSVPDRASLVQIRDELDQSTFAKCIKTLMTKESGKKAKADWTPDVMLHFTVDVETEQEILGGQPVAEEVMERTSKVEKEGQATATLRFNRVERNGQLNIVIRPDHVRGWLRDNFRPAGISDFFAKRCAVTPVFIPIAGNGKPGAVLKQNPIAGARMDRGMKVGTGITAYEALQPGAHFTLHLGIPQKAVGLPTAFVNHLIYLSETCTWVTGLGARAYGFGRLKVVDFKYLGTSQQIEQLFEKLDESPMVKKARELDLAFKLELIKKGAKAMGLAHTILTGMESSTLPVQGEVATDDTAAEED